MSPSRFTLFSASSTPTRFHFLKIVNFFFLLETFLERKICERTTSKVSKLIVVWRHAKLLSYTFFRNVKHIQLIQLNWEYESTGEFMDAHGTNYWTTSYENANGVYCFVHNQENDVYDAVKMNFLITDSIMRVNSPFSSRICYFYYYSSHFSFSLISLFLFTQKRAEVAHLYDIGSPPRRVRGQEFSIQFTIATKIMRVGTAWIMRNVSSWG